MKQKTIYVEINMNADIDELWTKTQQPDLHEQWDLRFSSIDYLPKETPDEAQKFIYETKIGMGIRVKGWGKSVGHHYTDNGPRTSALHFGTDQAISIIKEGRGYWKYIPNSDNEITFLTSYNYEPNWGRFGAVIDRFMFRPLMGWATALSFNVLKRWIETKETPQAQYFRFFTYWLLSGLFFFIWTYHGLVPKILHMHPSELAMVKNGLSLNPEQSVIVVYMLGALEVIFGFVWLFYRRKRRLFWIQLILFPLLTVVAAVTDPSNLNHPFSPLTFNLALFSLSLIGFMMKKDIPTAKSCKRST